MSTGFEDISGLSPRERLMMIGRLWDSLGNEDVPVTQAQKEELTHRLESFERDSAQGISWTRLKADLAHRDS